MTRKRFDVLPGFSLTLGFTLFYLSAVVLLPLAGLLLRSFELSWADFWRLVTTERAVAAYRLTFGASLVAALANAVFGTLLAWVLVRYEFPGRRFIDAMVDFPFALPTAVAGLTLASLFAANGWLGRYLVPLGIKGAYTPLGVVIALTFVGLPFVVRTLQPVLQTLEIEIEEAAATLGAGRLRTFVSIIAPSLLPAVLTGFALAFARAIGEYGSVVFISGNVPFKTEIAPYLIVMRLEEYDYHGAIALAVVLLGFSFVLLGAINILEQWAGNSNDNRTIMSAILKSTRLASSQQSHRGADESPVIKWALITLALGFCVVFLFLPLLNVFLQAFAKGWSYYRASLTSPDSWAAIRLTLLVSAISVPLNVVFGLAAAWALAKFEFRGKSLLITLIDLPFSVSPVVAGLMFLVLFGLQGYFGKWLQAHDLKIIFAVPGIVLATVFITFPFVARELIPVMQAGGTEQEQAALTLGANGWQTFWHVTLPSVKWGLVYGIILCNARAMGEFGAVSVVSGHISGRTDTMPLAVEKLYNGYDAPAAFAVASLLAMLALLTLALKTFLEWKQAREFARAQMGTAAPLHEPGIRTG